jgi:hypothetical protein
LCLSIVANGGPPLYFIASLSRIRASAAYELSVSRIGFSAPKNDWLARTTAELAAAAAVPQMSSRSLRVRELKIQNAEERVLNKFIPGSLSSFENMKAHKRVSWIAINRGDAI